MKIIGLTGGSGTGKTTALHAMTALGAYPIDCDELYHRLLAEDAALRQALVDRFGGTVANEHGGIDRLALGAIVFGDESARKDLGQVTNSFIVNAIHAEIAKGEAAGAPAVIIDAIGLVESGCAALAHRNIAITAPMEVRHARILQRDAFLTEETAWARLRAQKNDDFFREHCDYVLDNGGTEESKPAFAAQVQALYRDILNEG
jgi:dephospho-CoA kinase